MDCREIQLSCPNVPLLNGTKAAPLTLRHLIPFVMLPIKCTSPLQDLAVSIALLHPVPASSLPPPPPPHPFRSLMNCTNPRLTSNPNFLSQWSQTITRGESCACSRLAHGKWCALLARTHTHTHVHLHTQSQALLLIDRVMERFKIQLTCTVRQSLLSLEFNRLGQPSSWSEQEVILILSRDPSSFPLIETVLEKFLLLLL